MTARSSKTRIATLTIVGAGLFVYACTDAEPRTMGWGVVDGGSTPSFVDTPDASEAEAGDDLVSYCPAQGCSGGMTTCPGSRFACDTDLTNDVNNCGSCGFNCASNLSFYHFQMGCVGGQCVPRCADGYADCNGSLDDGCETELGSDDNCTACGDQCLDPAKPCNQNLFTNVTQCGCGASGGLYCWFFCVDPTTDDGNCGGCFNACDPAGDGSPLADHTHFGCMNSECGHAKCDSDHADCDGKATNGCEASLLSSEHCGACGHACDQGQTCIINRMGDHECACEAGKTLCGTECVDLLTNPRYCGDCLNDCSASAPWGSGIGSCLYGSCTYDCAEGRGDCNADLDDGCEANLLSDPRNCGGCGITCDLAAGQPCVRGSCAVEPCDAKDAGVVAK
ncbi:Tryptophan synthase alpha chain [Labilithrix luteola]|uniref:Tryptophan synthase alpha chain n=1 Tax=Labilithrix luteola TaxID=1391654 RepID=A0A0K1PWC2_9BACT|nr:hypothetical protein [Labilithrix luteola]AKU97820.1 Tryptophan synthase alpha chain [Labilithrix luteola]